jgi:hypothetical protein
MLRRMMNKERERRNRGRPQEQQVEERWRNEGI